LGVVGLIGILVFFAGAHLLWQGRREILFWLAEFFRILRGEFMRRDLGGTPPGAITPSESPVIPGVSRRDRGALRLASGAALLFLGQALFLLDLVF